MIEKKEGVCGGSACIQGTRLAVWVLAQFKNEGAEDEDILRWYPHITQVQLSEAWKYYDENSEEIDLEIYSNQDS